MESPTKLVDQHTRNERCRLRVSGLGPYLLALYYNTPSQIDIKPNLLLAGRWKTEGCPSTGVITSDNWWSRCASISDSVWLKFFHMNLDVPLSYNLASRK